MSLRELPIAANDGPVETFGARVGGGLYAASRRTTLQVNVGLVCNLACRHCHVESSPQRVGAGENLSAETATRILAWLAENPEVTTVDLTGGSPEMSSSFRPLVRGAKALGLHVMDRCNPTVLTATHPVTGGDFAWVPEFLAEHEVEVVASLPCYERENVEQQRGRRAYEESVVGLRLLNDVGYGRIDSLPLNLVYNPTGSFLPPPQNSLERDYRRELKERFDLDFTHLWTITNMPIKRWRADLERKGELEEYQRLLEASFNEGTVDGLMCRHQIHVDSQGRLHDCDFNYALGMRMLGREDAFLWDVTAGELAAAEVALGDHCFGCTAGAGSSCGGALA